MIHNSCTYSVTMSKFKLLRNKKFVAQFGPIDQVNNRAFDLAFWSLVSAEEKFIVTWQMAVDAWVIKGRKRHEFGFDRTFAVIKPFKD